MDNASIVLPDSEIEHLVMEGDCLRIRFSRAFIIKIMTGSPERTRWWQAGELVLDGAEITGDLPQGPLVCEGGDIEDNIYVYRDMIPLPLMSRGRVACHLRFQDLSAYLQVRASAMRMEMIDTPKYIEHLRS